MFPPRVVLAATDFSEPSRVALTFAARMAKQCGATLHVLHAADPLLAAAAQRAGVDHVRETRAELSTFMRAAEPAGDWAPIHHVIVGPSVDVISDIAQREGVDLIVVGMHGMSGPERRIFGSTTEGTLRNADTSVLAVPHTWTPPRPDLADLTGTGPLVAALDRTMQAMAATRAACQLAARLGTSVDAVHVVPELPVLQRWSAAAEEAQRDRVESSRFELRAALNHIGAEVPLTLHVEVGHVPERLAAAVTPSAGRHPMLVLGRRSRAQRGGSPGSTAYRVLTLAEVPVLMYLADE